MLLVKDNKIIEKFDSLFKKTKKIKINIKKQVTRYKSSVKKFKFFFLKNIKLQDKNKLKNEVNSSKENTISLNVVFNIDSILFAGIKPPEDIMLMDKFNESKVLISAIFKIINKIKVKTLYNIRILKDCLIVSVILKDKKFVKDFFKLSSKTSIIKIIENKK